MEDVITRSEYEAEIKRLDTIRDEALKRQEDENNRQNKRIDVLETKVHDLSRIITSIEKMTAHMENIDLELKRQGERLKETDERIRGLENRDGEMWRTILTHIATLVVGAIVAFALAKIGF